MAHADRKWKMKERPILFSGPMVCAINDGRKTQTRRVVKPQPWHDPLHRSVDAPARHGDDWTWWAGTYTQSIYHSTPCPYGKPGDRLWVRETCRAHELTDAEAENDTYGVIERLGLETPPYGLDGVVYTADNAFREIRNTIAAGEAWAVLHGYGKKRGATVPAIHMPRWASRITLEITGVRVERLQDISDDNIVEEGVELKGLYLTTALRRCEWRRLWESINGPDSWQANPWVWVVEFKRI